MLKNVTAALIAGGKSKRFGSPKHLAEFSGKSLFERAFQLVHIISDDALIIGTDNFKRAGLHPLFNDLVPGCGPLGGIYTALYYSSQPFTAILPVDMPLLSIEVYNIIFESARESRPVVARSHKGLEPLVSIWPKSSFSAVEERIKTGDYGLHQLLSSLNAKEVDFSADSDYQPQWFANVNYPEDLAKLNP